MASTEKNPQRDATGPLMIGYSTVHEASIVPKENVRIVDESKTMPPPGWCCVHSHTLHRPPCSRHHPHCRMYVCLPVSDGQIRIQDCRSRYHPLHGVIAVEERGGVEIVAVFRAARVERCEYEEHVRMLVLAHLVVRMISELAGARSGG